MGTLEALQNGWRRTRDAFDYAFGDPAWPFRYLKLAFILLIPVVGYLALLGWQVRVFDSVRLGRRGLPVPELSTDIGRGVPTFINAILLFVVPVFLAAFLALPLDALGIPPNRYTDPEVLRWLASTFVVVAYPELLRRSVVRGEKLALLKPFPSFRAMLHDPVSFAFTLFGTVVALLVASFGIYAFGVGVLFTIPIGHAMAAHVVVHWQRDLETGSA